MPLRAPIDPSHSDDICPVCKSNRYLNPTLAFLINPECYHKMCSTCVDRLFTAGPAPCPVPYCGKTLRKRAFHKAFFADLKVEREVDIRKRVGAVFNRRQEDFETLKDWNNYLEEVEGLVFDLMAGGKEDKARAEEKLRVYKEGNKGEIEENRRAGEEEIEMIRNREEEEKERARLRRLADLREQQEEKEDVQRLSRDTLDKLASGVGDANKITQQAQKVLLKKASTRRNIVDSTQEGSAGAASSLSIRGLRKKAAPVEEGPYDPFGGMVFTSSRYVLQDEYDNEWLDQAKRDPRHMAGGYSMQEFYARTMLEAFSGLGVFIEDEVAGRPRAGSPGVGTAAAVEASDGGKAKAQPKIESDNVF